jgi:KDO2-lipid IV(A) lauroyltransferase
MKDILIYYFIRIITFPISYLPLTSIRFLGKILGLIAFYLLKDFRKTALSNLALASDLKLNEKQIYSIAKKSFQNLVINILEFPKFSKVKNFNKILKCENPQKAYDLHNKGKGIIFFSGHQANWEVLLLDACRHIQGIAIGRPIKNKRLYEWIKNIRERTGGKIISPKQAIKEGLRSLRKGGFIGIVGDQGMPQSNYSFPFFGRRAWNSTAPALLAYKTNGPIFVANPKRVKNGYTIKYSDPIWPNLKNPMDKEVPILMDKILFILQESIKKTPDEWLWQHNRWKQKTPHIIYKKFRKDSIAIILPEDKQEFLHISKHINFMKKIYSPSFIFLFIPLKFSHYKLITADETIIYNKTEDLFTRDHRFKLVFNFTNIKKLKTHFKKLSAFDVFQLSDLWEMAKDKKIEKENLSQLFQTVLCRNGYVPE